MVTFKNLIIYSNQLKFIHLEYIYLNLQIRGMCMYICIYIYIYIYIIYSIDYFNLLLIISAKAKEQKPQKLSNHVMCHVTSQSTSADYTIISRSSRLPCDVRWWNINITCTPHPQPPFCEVPLFLLPLKAYIYILYTFGMTRCRLLLCYKTTLKRNFKDIQSRLP